MSDRRIDPETRMWFDVVLKASEEDQHTFEESLRQLVHRCKRRFEELANERTYVTNDEMIRTAVKAADVMLERELSLEETE